MLHEISHIRQSDCSHVKRWFTSIDMDLFVWFNKEENHSVPLRFQFCFNKCHDEYAISWDMQRGLQFFQIDSGEPFPHHYKLAPLMTDTLQQRDLATIASDFLAASENIDISLSDFIYERLMQYQR